MAQKSKERKLFLFTLKMGVRVALVQAQSEHRQLSQRMLSDAEMEQDWGVIIESDILEVL